MINTCSGCLEKQQKIDRLETKVESLEEKLRYRTKKENNGFFGSGTPSSKMPVKANTEVKKASRPRGAQKGHKGVGRQNIEEHEADYSEDRKAPVGDYCPECNHVLENKGMNSRPVIESKPLRAEKVLYRLEKKYCPRCRKVFRGQPPSLLPKSLYGNQLIANAITMHYLHGIPLGRICEQIGIGPGSLVTIFHRIAQLFGGVPEKLIEVYRGSPVKHADETGWRTEGKNGYVWLFATDRVSIFQFHKTRSSQVPKELFGDTQLPGVLVVDRYAGYNKAPCRIQYCYAHILREVQDLEKEFPDSTEIKTFVSTLAPLLSLAMGLRNHKISDRVFYTKASRTKQALLDVIKSSAQHMGIRKIQDIFRDNENKMFHWVDDRRVPAENNLAERDLRPTVIARKVSFGSQSDAGAHTRSVLTSVLWSLKKQNVDVSQSLKNVLDQLAQNITQDLYPLLFPQKKSLPKKSRDKPTRH